MHLAIKIPMTSLHGPSWRTVALWFTCMATVMGHPAVWAADPLTESVLAACPVQSLTPQAEMAMIPDPVARNMYQAPEPDFLANYSRNIDGQWHIPAHVDVTSPWVRLMILGPGRPTLIDVAIYVDGEPYSVAREKLIDELMDHASLEALVREAVAIPVPETSQDADAPAREPASLPDDASNDQGALEDSKTEDGAFKTPLVEVKRRATRSIAQRLVNYMAAADVKADREEIRWLMAEWTGGPALLTLGPAMSWQRVNLAPLWDTLDVDGDQLLSAGEISTATERLSQADIDENSIIELEELASLGRGTSTAPHSYPLLVVIDHETDWQQLSTQLHAAYSAYPGRAGHRDTSPLLRRIADGDAALTPDNLKALIAEEPAIRVRVSLAGSGSKSQVALLSAGGAEFYANDRVVTVVRGAEYFEFSAGEPANLAPTDPAASQISVGAVIDGYPLFRLVDRNGDRRLSPRECRNLAQVLAAVDRNGDQAISAAERPTAIRIAITRGPGAHEMLDKPSSAARKFSAIGMATSEGNPANAAVAKLPSWFTDMDQNQDGDLSRNEFLGTSEQFRQLDRDRDGLISSQEIGQ